VDMVVKLPTLCRKGEEVEQRLEVWGRHTAEDGSM